MNTWQDIKKNPPNSGEVVLVTDEVVVWCGIIGYNEIFRGINLNDGYHEDIPVSGLKQWQPAPNTFVPEKSADEMFRELGYNPVGSRRYVKPIRVDNNGLWTYTEIIIDEDEIIKQTQVEPERSVYYEYLSAKEVLACAQLIREMEESKNE